MPRTASVRHGRLALTLVALLAGASAASARPTSYRQGFNLFSPQQDVEIGRQSAAAAGQQLPLLRDRAVDTYLEAIVRRLAAHAPGERYPYQIQAVNSSDVNAFALPGGFLYVNRGTLEAASNEGELAGVLAHEMAHVALRHGTHQASRAYVAQAGLAVLGGAVAGRSGRGTSQVLSALGGLGLNALFLRYSRDAETQADVVGAQIMAASGYDPESMATMFDKLQAMQRSQPSRLAQFFSDHPASADRAQRIRQEARELGPVTRTAQVGGFEQVRSGLRSRGPAPAAGAPLREARAESRGDGRGTTATGARSPVGVELEPPSPRFRSFSQRAGFFTLEYPENWQAFESERGYGATLVPAGGAVETRDGEQALVCGVIVNHYDPFDESRSSGPLSLAQATDDVVEQVRRGNPYLQPEGSPRRTSVDGLAALRVQLSGRSPLSGQDEQVTLYTRALGDDHVLYALFVVPRAESARFEPAFSRMLDSLNVDDRAAHR